MRRFFSTICSTSKLDPSTIVEVNAVVKANATIGKNCIIRSGSVIGENVTVADNVVVGYNVTLQHCDIGSNVLIHPGACIGQDGFGFHLDDNSTKKEHNFRVVIHSNVEIGANCTIDRGSWRDTEIRENSKLDNLIQIGHNVIIGKNCLICGQSGIAGSSVLGNNVALGGQVGIVQRVTIGDNTKIAARSFVVSDLTGGKAYGGSPAVDIVTSHKRGIVLDRLVAKIRTIK